MRIIAAILSSRRAETLAMPAPVVTQATIKRAIEATKAAGLIPTAVEVRKDGTVRVETLETEAGEKKSLDRAGGNVEPLKPKKWATR